MRSALPGGPPAKNRPRAANRSSNAVVDLANSSSSLGSWKQRETEGFGYQYPFSTQPDRVAACR
jgi:hypothetical protein